MVKKYTIEPQQKVVEQLSESAMTLSNKAQLSLYKKANYSNIPYYVLEEVYRRGYSIWNENFGETPEKFAFDRVNSFISGGFARELDEDLIMEKRGLWDNIHAKRERIKRGSGERMRKPGEKGAPSAEALRRSQNEEYIEEKVLKQKTSKDPDNPLSRLDASKSGVKIYKQDTPGEPGKPHHKLKKTIKTIKETVQEKLEEATYQGKSVTLNKPFKTPGGRKKSAVYVKDPKSGKVRIVRFGDPNLSIKKDQPARKRSYCARSSGQGNLTNKLSANYWSRRAWNCEETIIELTTPEGTTGKRSKWNAPRVPIRMADGSIKKLPPGKSGSSGGGGDE